MIDGKIINQFDNSIPKINTRAGDPPTMARQFTQGYLGLQTHGGTDRISYREIQVKDVAAADIPVNTVAPSVTGSGFQGKPLTCNRGTWNTAAGTTYFVKWYRSNKILPTNPRFRAPSATDYWNQTTPADPHVRHAGADVDRLAAARRRRHLHARPPRTSARSSTAPSTPTTPARRSGRPRVAPEISRRPTPTAARAAPCRRR